MSNPRNYQVVIFIWRTKEMTNKEDKRMYTMDDDEYYKIPPVEYKMSKEQSEQLDKDYPPPDKASYLRYPCQFCNELFFLISPYRSKGMNPYSEGFMVKYKNSKRKTKVPTPTCRKCLLDLCNRDESVWISGYKEG
jgi:hypothetical protein